MKTIVLFTILLPMTLCAQLDDMKVTTYTSLEDYQNGNGSIYEYLSHSGYYQVDLHLTQYGEKVEVKCEDIWAFKFNGAFFRIRAIEGHPYRLISEGNICYYEDGTAHLKMFERGENTLKRGDYSTDNDVTSKFQCFSKNKTSKMIHYSVAKNKSLKRKYPEYAEVFDCVNESLKEKSFGLLESFKYCCLLHNKNQSTE